MNEKQLDILIDWKVDIKRERQGNIKSERERENKWGKKRSGMMGMGKSKGKNKIDEEILMQNVLIICLWK